MTTSDPRAGAGRSVAGASLPSPTAPVTSDGGRRLLAHDAGAKRGAGWTAEADAELTRLWMQADPYMTGSEIAAHFGLTKNAIVGRARRINLPQRGTIELNRPTRAAVYGDDVRRLAAQGRSQREIALALGIGRASVAWICEQIGLRMSRDEMRHAVAASNRKRAGERRAARSKAAPNPFLTPAQQENVAAQTRRMWGNPRLRAMAPPTAEEAARLVAEHIAKHGVTKCIPAAEVKVPTNCGVGFR
jgi:hypothetical protein